MKALILKDIATMKKTILLCLLLFAGICIYSIWNGSTLVIPFLSAMLPLALTGISFGYDARSNFVQYAFSMPITKTGFVLSKFFFTAVFALIGSLAVFFLLPNRSLPLTMRLLLTLLNFVAVFLLAAIQFPLSFQFGAEKGRLVFMIAYFLGFCLISQFKEAGSWLVRTASDAMSSLPFSLLAAGLLLLALLVIFLCIRISIRILEKKEY